MSTSSDSPVCRIRPVIMCGGAGARLWPFSRPSFPKQLLPIVGDESMLQQTAARVASGEFAAPVLVAGYEHGAVAERQLRDIGISPAAILLEPEPRNTAAVAALASEWALATGLDELLLLMPADHVILDRAAFADALRTGTAPADGGAIVTFGVRPNDPNTQYGYIEADVRSAADPVHSVLGFVEKPDLETATRIYRSGRHYWNSGILMARASSLRDELAKHLPATARAIARAFEDRAVDGIFIRPERQSFNSVENISIDYAVMQKTDRAFVVPVDMGWSDVGSWFTVWSNSEKDEQNNVTSGDVLIKDTRNSLVRSHGAATIVTIGLEDVVVVGTRDAVLVAPLSRANEVQEIARQLANSGRTCATISSTAADAPRAALLIEEAEAAPPSCAIQHPAADAGDLPLRIEGQRGPSLDDPQIVPVEEHYGHC